MSLARRLLILAATGAILAGLGGTAAAQDEPTPAPSESVDTPDIELELPVTFDEDGNPIWTTAGGGSESPDAPATVTGEATPAPTEGADTPTDEPTSGAGVVVDDGSGGEEGGGLPLVPIGAAVIVAAAGSALLVRRRVADRTEVGVQIENPMVTAEGLGVTDLGTPIHTAQYAGANEAGAYQAGGAAFAQHVNASYGAADVRPDRSGVSARFQDAKVAMTRVADKQLENAGKHKIIAKKLASGGSQMTPGEWLVIAGSLTLGGLVIGALLRNPIMAVLLASAGAFGSWMWLSRAEGRRQKAFSQQLPETLGLLAGSLRAGMSMIQSISTVSEEADSPTSDEFQRVVTEIRLGRDLSASFRDMAQRMASKDFEWVVVSIDIHREVGGDLSVILDRVADTIRARNRVFGQMKALSAEGRMSGIILFILPPAMVGMISILNPDYLGDMTGNGFGVIMLIVAVVLLTIGGAWMKRLIRFDY